MHFSIYNDNEIIQNLSNKMFLNQKTGSLFVEILNNYSDIKNKIATSIKKIIENKDNGVVKSYLDNFILASVLNNNLRFFYLIINYEFDKINEEFSNKRIELNSSLESVTKTLNNISDTERDYKWLFEYKKSLENSLKDFSFERQIQEQLMFLDSLLNTLDINYFFINNYNDLKNEFYFKTFEIPRQIISSVIENNNEIRLLESKNQSLCGSVEERNAIENKFNDKIKYLITYDIEKCSDLFDIYRKLIIDKKICIKKCKNCNNFFITTSRTDEVYCNNISPQNKNKTCKQYGAKKTYKDKIQSNQIRNEKEKTMQFYRMRIKRTNDNVLKSKYEYKLEKFKKNFDTKLKQFKSNKISEDVFVEWIKNQKIIPDKNT